MIDVNKMESVISSDIGLDLTVIKGQSVPVNNCWHFYTNGDSVNILFHDSNEFLDGMNRIFPVIDKYNVLILAFVLMDTHVHFILYGDFDSCNLFIHEYVRRTSMYLSSKYPGRNALKSIEISHQVLEDDRYLKMAICYVLKNPVSAGLPYNAWDYPWSSGPLYFRHSDTWASPKWMLGMDEVVLGARDMRKLVKSRSKMDSGIKVLDGLILPSQYVSVAIVEELFRSHKAFNFFMSISKAVDVESRGGDISHLTVPLREMMDNRNILSQEMFGITGLRRLNMGQRVQLAKRLRSLYNCSPKQIAKLCGLVYNEVSDLI